MFDGGYITTSHGGALKPLNDFVTANLGLIVMLIIVLLIVDIGVDAGLYSKVKSGLTGKKKVEHYVVHDYGGTQRRDVERSDTGSSDLTLSDRMVLAGQHIHNSDGSVTPVATVQQPSGQPAVVATGPTVPARVVSQLVGAREAPAFYDSFSINAVSTDGAINANNSFEGMQNHPKQKFSETKLAHALGPAQAQVQHFTPGVPSSEALKPGNVTRAGNVQHLVPMKVGAPHH